MSSTPPENKEGEQSNKSGHPCETTDRLDPIRGHGNHNRIHSYQQPIIIPCCGTKVVVTNKSSSSSSIPPTTIQISSPTTIITTTPGAGSSSSVVITSAITSAGDVITSIPVVTRTVEASTALTTATAGDTDSTALSVGTNSLSKGTPVLVTAADSTALPVGTNSLSKGTPVLVTSSNEAFIGLNIPTTSSTTTTTPSTSSSTATSLVRPVLSSRASALTHPHLHQGRPKRRRRPFSPWRTEMGAVAPCDTPGLLHPAGEVNGHARPQGAGVSRDVLGNVSPLPASPTAPTERLIGPVRVTVAPPPLRTAETRRERQRLAFVNQRLMSKPVKRKLWEVDHDTVEADVEAELNQIVEEEERRFREKYEVLKPEKNPHAPRFYYSEVISSKKKEVLVPSSSPTSSASPRTSSSSSAGFGSTSVHSDSKTSSESITKASSNESPPVAQSTPKADDGQRKPEGVLGDPNSSSDSSSVCVTPKPPGQRGVVTEGKSFLLEKQNLVNNRNQNLPDTPSSPLDSPSTLSSSSSSSVFSSSLNLSTASRSSSGVSSLESTPTQERLTSQQQTVTPTQTITPAGSGTPIQGGGGGGAPPTAERIAPTQETTAPTQRPTTRSCRQRRSSQRTESGPPRKNLRM